jgi:phage portal protein BeeE
MLNSEIYNASNFSNGINVNGILAVKTKMNPQLFRSFRREFYSMLTGANNSKKTPLIQLDPDNDEDVKAVNLSSTNKEMEFQEWMNYLIKIACSVYQIDPAEIGFIFGTEGSRNTLYNAGPSERVLMSKEKGLRPTLRAIESWINRYVIDQIDPRFELFFTGLDTLSMKEKIELDGMRVRTFMTVNEVRALHDLPPIPNGNTILDQNFNTRRFYNAATDPDVSYLYDVVDPTTNVFKDENKDKK